MMKSVYTVMWHGPDGVHLDRICGSQEHAVNTYREVTGKPGAVTRQSSVDDHAVLYLDEGRDWTGVVAEYRVDFDTE